MENKIVIGNKNIFKICIVIKIIILFLNKNEKEIKK